MLYAASGYKIRHRSSRLNGRCQECWCPMLRHRYFASWGDYLARTSERDRMARCRAAAKKANQKRLLSDAPITRLTAHDVWEVIQAAKGRCAHCGSLAVENRPSGPRGAPIPRRKSGVGSAALSMSDGDTEAAVTTSQISLGLASGVTLGTQSVVPRRSITAAIIQSRSTRRFMAKPARGGYRPVTLVSTRFRPPAGNYRRIRSKPL